MVQGGIMQLVAYGAQDAYLTANPQVTFFKQLYRRHSNFAMESIEQVFNGVPNFGKRVQCVIARNGDLIHRMYLQITLPSVDLNDPTVSDASGDQFRWLNWVGLSGTRNRASISGRSASISEEGKGPPAGRG